MPALEPFKYTNIVSEICNLNWEILTGTEMIDVASAYYYFSIQFRENLEIACRLYPDDRKLRQLHAEECGTGNLSPWPRIAEADERLDHDEFMRRLLKLAPVGKERQSYLEAVGKSYLNAVRNIAPVVRAKSIGSYEGGDLARIFRAFLRSRDWNGDVLGAFRHFLVKHIAFDGEAVKGHQVLSRHLEPDDRIVPLWTEFKRLLIGSVPSLRMAASQPDRRHARPASAPLEPAFFDQPADAVAPAYARAPIEFAAAAAPAS